MSEQNIFNNDVFFENYKKLRECESCANDLFEKPALFELIDDINGKDILDLGCGYGENCAQFIKMGARCVTGLDISDKMLAVAKTENSDENITYINMSMEDIATLDDRYDIIISSLAIHYIDDFDLLLQNIYDLLNDGGVFIFSQEHPLNTCFTGGNRWTRDSDGNVLYTNLSNYCISGKRTTTWFVDGVVKYHRTFSSIINSLVCARFKINKMVEPIPDDEIMEQYPKYKKCIHKPNFLLIRALK